MKTYRREQIVILALTVTLLAGMGLFISLSQTFLERDVIVIPELAADVAARGDPAQVKQATEIAKLAAEVNQIRSDTSGSLFWLKTIGLFITVAGAIGGYLIGLTRTTQQKLDFENRKNIDSVYQGIIAELADQNAPILRATAAVKLGSILESYPSEWRLDDDEKSRAQLVKRTKQVLAAALALEANTTVLKTITIALPLHKPWADDPAQPAKARYGDLREIDLSGATARDAYWARVDFSYADFYQADLTRASLRNAILAGAQFRETNLEDAVLMGAQCTDANFKLASLRGADLTDCRDLDSAKFEDTIYDERTRFPSGFDPRQRGLRTGGPQHA
ncbi:MAG: pentapeptide repeat-containing protein [Burkholderiales bacterium]